MLTNEKNYPIQVKFPINKAEYIILYIPHINLENLDMWDNCPGYYHNNQGQCLEAIYSYYGIASELGLLISRLTLSLNNQLEIDRTLFPNIGYQWNQYCNRKSKKEIWNGTQYLCFSTAQGPETFIYTENQQIILEIVPTYPWLFGREPKGIKKITFKEFLRTYKPYVKTTITHATAQEWLATAQYLRDIIDRNEQK